MPLIVRPSPGAPLMLTGDGLGRPPSLVQEITPSSLTLGVKTGPTRPCHMRKPSSPSWIISKPSHSFSMPKSSR